MKAPQNHLEFYKELGVSPVHQDISDLRQHFDRRRSLYRSLGVLPSMIRGADVLEVAPGSGHNSLFIAACGPQSLTLVEPNPVGARELGELYGSFSVPHTAPNLVVSKLEGFTPDKSFDIAICEGWLGSDPHEHKMLGKLGSMVKPGGVVCVSLVSPIGLLANILRRLLSVHVVGATDAEDRVGVLARAFASHLATLPDMSRPVEDWIIDNMINPAWYGVCLTPAMAVKALGPAFEHLGFSPRMIVDWRWYKSLHGDNRRVNEMFLVSFYSTAHNLLDYRDVVARHDPSGNRDIEAQCFRLLECAMAYEYQSSGLASVQQMLGELENLTRSSSTTVADAIAETSALLSRPSVTPEDISDIHHLAPLFGREMMYASFIRED